jgi:hypothetical protein
VLQIAQSVTQQYDLVQGLFTRSQIMHQHIISLLVS